MIWLLNIINLYTSVDLSNSHKSHVHGLLSCRWHVLRPEVPQRWQYAMSNWSKEKVVQDPELVSQIGSGEHVILHVRGYCLCGCGGSIHLTIWWRAIWVRIDLTSTLHHDHRKVKRKTKHILLVNISAFIRVILWALFLNTTMSASDSSVKCPVGWPQQKWAEFWEAKEIHPIQHEPESLAGSVQTTLQFGELPSESSVSHQLIGMFALKGSRKVLLVPRTCCPNSHHSFRSDLDYHSHVILTDFSWFSSTW